MQISIHCRSTQTVSGGCGPLKVRGRHCTRVNVHRTRAKLFNKSQPSSCHTTPKRTRNVHGGRVRFGAQRTGVLHRTRPGRGKHSVATQHTRQTHCKRRNHVISNVSRDALCTCPKLPVRGSWSMRMTWSQGSRAPDPCWGSASSAPGHTPWPVNG